MAAAGNVSNLPKNTGAPVGAGKGADNEAPSGPQYGEFGAKDNEEMRAALQTYLQNTQGLKDKRKEINQQLKAEREGILNRGMNRAAIAEAERLHALTTAQRDGYDLSIGIARKAWELPIQAPSFEGAQAQESARH